MSLRYGLILAAALTLAWSDPVFSDTDAANYEILATLAGVPAAEGTLVRKMMTPISFAMGQEGGQDSRFAPDLAFFKELDSEVRVFLRETLESKFSTDAGARSIRVVVLFPDAHKGGDDAWLTKMFRFGDAAVRDQREGDYYLMECRDLVLNLGDPYNDLTPPDDEFAVVMAATVDADLSVRGVGYDRDDVTRCLYRHVLAALGLRGSVPPGYDSVLSEDNPAIRPTEFDHWLVETLYRSDSQAGERVESVLPEPKDIAQ